MRCRRASLIFRCSRFRAPLKAFYCFCRTACWVLSMFFKNAMFHVCLLLRSMMPRDDSLCLGYWFAGLFFVGISVYTDYYCLPVQFYYCLSADAGFSCACSDLVAIWLPLSPPSCRPTEQYPPSCVSPRSKDVSLELGLGFRHW